MSIRHTRTLVWLLLALLGLRGLVPAGYMIEAGRDGLSLVVCGSGIYAAAAQQTQSRHGDRGEHAHHAGEGAHGSGHAGGAKHADSKHAGSDHSICPFALAATGAQGFVSIAPVSFLDHAIAHVSAEPLRPISSFGPSRAQQSRAPPFSA